MRPAPACRSPRPSKRGERVQGARRRRPRRAGQPAATAIGDGSPSARQPVSSHGISPAITPGATTRKTRLPSAARMRSPSAMPGKPAGSLETSTPVVTVIALMRRASRLMVEELVERLRAAGFDDMTAAHHPVFENLDRDGTRLTVLAARTGMTHQSMGELVGALERAGYVQRRPDPGRPRPARRADGEGPARGPAGADGDRGDRGGVAGAAGARGIRRRAAGAARRRPGGTRTRGLTRPALQSRRGWRDADGRAWSGSGRNALFSTAYGNVGLVDLLRARPRRGARARPDPGRVRPHRRALLLHRDDVRGGDRDVPRGRRLVAVRAPARSTSSGRSSRPGRRCSTTSSRSPSRRSSPRATSAGCRRDCFRLAGRRSWSASG